MFELSECMCCYLLKLLIVTRMWAIYLLYLVKFVNVVKKVRGCLLELSVHPALHNRTIDICII